MQQRYMTQLSADTVLRQQAVQRFVTDTSAELHPEIVGVTLFGSAARGDASIESDLDGYLFIDVTHLPGNPKEPVVQDHDEPALSEPLLKMYRLVIDGYFVANTTFTAAQVSHIKPLPINATVIDEELEKLAKEEEQEGYREDAHHPPRCLYGLFHFSIGGGLAVYQEYVVKKLSQMGGVGERIWASILSSTESMEQHLSNGETEGYPRTLEEARKVYLLK
jgi:predicted nucleotidyltransferase